MEYDLCGLQDGEKWYTMLQCSIRKIEFTPIAHIFCNTIHIVSYSTLSTISSTETYSEQIYIGSLITILLCFYKPIFPFIFSLGWHSWRMWRFYHLLQCYERSTSKNVFFNIFFKTDFLIIVLSSQMVIVLVLDYARISIFFQPKILPSSLYNCMIIFW